MRSTSEAAQRLSRRSPIPTSRTNDCHSSKNRPHPAASSAASGPALRTAPLGRRSTLGVCAPRGCLPALRELIDARPLPLGPLQLVHIPKDIPKLAGQRSRLLPVIRRDRRREHIPQGFQARETPPTGLLGQFWRPGGVLSHFAPKTPNKKAGT